MIFTISGPGPTFGNMPVVIEHHVEWIVDLLKHMDAGGRRCVEASLSAQPCWTGAYRKELDKVTEAHHVGLESTPAELPVSR